MPFTDEGEVRVTLEDSILEVLLDRPTKRNAFNRRMMEGVNAALLRAENDANVKVVLLLGEGADFSAGLDAATFSEGPNPDMSEAGRFIRNFARASKPLVAGVQGRAVGVGFTLMLHCDWVIAADDSLLFAPFVSLGLVPEAASTVLLRQRVGYARAFEILSSARRLTGADAAAWGAINAAVPAADVRTSARAVAAKLAGLPASPLQSTKRLMRNIEGILATMDREGAVFDAHMADLLSTV